MRLFVAVDLNKDIKDAIGVFIDSLRREDENIRWVKPENLHITLKFLGEVREVDVKQYVKVIENGLQGIGSFKISVEGTGVFGSVKRPRTLWVDVKMGNEYVKKLIEKMKLLGNDVKVPSVHVTIGRVRSSSDVYQRMREMGDVKFGKMDVKKVTLFQSTLRKEGPVYTTVREFSL